MRDAQSRRRATLRTILRLSHLVRSRSAPLGLSARDAERYCAGGAARAGRWTCRIGRLPAAVLHHCLEQAHDPDPGGQWPHQDLVYSGHPPPHHHSHLVTSSVPKGYRGKGWSRRNTLVQDCVGGAARGPDEAGVDVRSCSDCCHLVWMRGVHALGALGTPKKFGNLFTCSRCRRPLLNS